MPENTPIATSLTRRSLFGAAATAALAGCASTGTKTSGSAVTHGRIRQSIVHWCFGTRGWKVADTARAAKSLGCLSVELVGPEDWAPLKEHGLTCAIAPNGMPGAPFVKGLNNLKYHSEILERTQRMIDACADSKGLCDQVIAFNGFKYRDAEDPKSGEISREEGAANCVKGLKALGAYAAKKKITVSIEMLNTRDDTHPMKGHPGYQGDDIDYVMDIVKAVNMDNVKVLFDIYHVQIMNGDIIRRIDQYKDLIGHIHTAGNPGRGELHLDQEIHYPATMKALIKAGYKGYVGQEFIPVTDPMDSLRQAVSLCDV